MANDDVQGLDPETQAALLAFGEETAAGRAHRVGSRTASEVINEDQTPRPYSVRLTAREIHRLRVMARTAELKPSELVRQFILDGLLRLESTTAATAASPGEGKRIMQIKLALLGAYNLVENLEHEQPRQA